MFRALPGDFDASFGVPVRAVSRGFRADAPERVAARVLQDVAFVVSGV